MEIPRHWRLKQQRYALVGETCPHCQTKLFPPRDVCPSCGGEAKTPYTFSGKGKVYSYTVMTDAPAGYQEQAPYTVALVQLDEGPMIIAQLTDLGEQPVEIGMPVEWSHARSARMVKNAGCWCTGRSYGRCLPVRVKFHI